MQSGEQTRRMMKWLENGLWPIYQKHGFDPRFLIQQRNRYPALPTALIVIHLLSRTDMETMWGKLNSDPDYAGVVAEIEEESRQPAFYRTESQLFARNILFAHRLPQRPPVSLAMNSMGCAAQRVKPTNHQLVRTALHDRFAPGRDQRFSQERRIHPILYADTVFGPNQPNMAYLIPFDSADHREKAWAAFRNDPDWIKIRDESIQRGGEIVREHHNHVSTSPTGFSMIPVGDSYVDGCGNRFAQGLSPLFPVGAAQEVEVAAFVGLQDVFKEQFAVARAGEMRRAGVFHLVRRAAISPSGTRSSSSRAGTSSSDFITVLHDGQAGRPRRLPEQCAPRWFQSWCRWIRPSLSSATHVTSRPPSAALRGSASVPIPAFRARSFGPGVLQRSTITEFSSTFKFRVVNARNQIVIVFKHHGASPMLHQVAVKRCGLLDHGPQQRQSSP